MVFSKKCSTEGSLKFELYLFCFARDSQHNVLDDGHSDGETDYQVKGVVVILKKVLPQWRYNGHGIMEGLHDTSSQWSSQLSLSLDTDQGEGQGDNNGNSQSNCSQSPDGGERDLRVILNTQDETTSGRVPDTLRRVVKPNSKYSREMYDLN